jgi:FkbM family methyltransferase
VNAPGLAGVLAALEARLWEGVRGGLGFDVGANSGQSVAQMAPRFGRVVALEPALESFALLAASCRDSRVSCLNIAASDHDGTLRLAERAGPMASGQLTAADTSGFCADWGPATAIREVPCTTLDTLAEREGVPDFVKIDTEGGEAAVLRGMTGLLAGRRPDLLIEFHAAALREECLAILSAAGYETETVRAPHLEEGSAFWLGYGWLAARGTHSR